MQVFELLPMMVFKECILTFVGSIGYKNTLIKIGPVEVWRRIITQNFMQPFHFVPTSMSLCTHIRNYNIH